MVDQLMVGLLPFSIQSLATKLTSMDTVEVKRGYKSIFSSSCTFLGRLAGPVSLITFNG